MVKLVALYKKPEDAAAFEQHYYNVHMPLTEKIPGLKHVEISKFTGSPMGECEHILMCEMYYDNMDDLKAGMSSPEGRAAGKDVMNFGKGLATFLIAEVEEKVLAKAAV